MSLKEENSLRERDKKLPLRFYRSKFSSRPHGVFLVAGKKETCDSETGLQGEDGARGRFRKEFCCCEELAAGIRLCYQVRLGFIICFESWEILC